MTLHRKSVYVKARALRSMNCAEPGDVVHFVKTRNGWQLINGRHNDKIFSATSRNIRNEKFFQVLEQL